MSEREGRAGSLDDGRENEESDEEPVDERDRA